MLPPRLLEPLEKPKKKTPKPLGCPSIAESGRAAQKPAGEGVEQERVEAMQLLGDGAGFTAPGSERELDVFFRCQSCSKFLAGFETDTCEQKPPRVLLYLRGPQRSIWR